MSCFIELSWTGLEVSAKAELLTEFNPSLSERFIETLPFESIQSHAVVAGKQMYFPYRLLDDTAYRWERMDKQPIGRINIEFNFQYLSINYGPMTEPVPAVPLAQIIEEDIEKLKMVGKEVWNNLLHEEQYLTVNVNLIGGEVK